MRTKLGLIICGIGETIADAGAWMAGCTRLRSKLTMSKPVIHWTNEELDEEIERRGCEGRP